MRIHAHVAALADEVSTLGIRHSMVVTDKSCVSNGRVRWIADHLPNEVGVTVYGETPGAPTETAARDAAEIFVAHGCDGIIGVGDRFTLDLARLTGLLASHNGPLSQYHMRSGGIGRIVDCIPPIIAVSTGGPANAGERPMRALSSEIGHNIIDVPIGEHRVEVYSPFLVPQAAINDPALICGHA